MKDAECDMDMLVVQANDYLAVGGAVIGRGGNV